MNFENLAYEVRDGVAHIRLNQPERANALNPALSRDLRQVMLDIEWDDAVKAISLTSEGKVFCAGGDLKEFHSAGDNLPKLVSEMLTDFQNH